VSPRSASLVTQARAQLARGATCTGGIGRLDRAPQLEPSNPRYGSRWRGSGSPPTMAARPARVARQALSLAGGDRRARTYAGRALADALRAQHRDQEARELETQPWMN
jgi:hypothetical protein